MAFNLQGALDEGYTYAEIAQHLAEKRGFDYAGASSEGYSDEEIVDHLTSTAPEEFAAPEKKEWSLGDFFGGNEALATGGAQLEGELGDTQYAAQGGLDPEEVQRTARGLAGGITSASAGAVGGVADIAGATADLLNPFEEYTGSARERVRPFVEEMQDVQQLERQIGQENAPTGKIAKVAYDSATAMGQMAPMIAAFMITKNPTVALSTMGTQVGGQTWAEKKAEGWSDLDAGLETAKQVAYEIGPERIFGVFQKMGGVTMMRDLLELAVAESGSEAVTELLNITEESIKKGGDTENFDFGEFWDNLKSQESADRVNYAALLGGILGLGMGGPGAISTNINNERLRELEEEMNAANYVRASMANKAAEERERLDAAKTERQAKRDAARQRARERIDEVLGRERDSVDFDYEGTAGTVGLDIPQTRILDDYGRPMDNIELSGFETQFDAPTAPATEQRIPMEPIPETIESSGTDPNFAYGRTETLGFPGGRVDNPTQAEIELLGRQRDPRELRDPQNVPPVGQAMVDEILDVDQYSPEELAAAARQRIESRDEQVPGLKQRALEEIDQLERDATQGSGMWKTRAIDDLKSIVRTQLDSTNLRGRVADRLRVMPLEESVDVAQEPETQVEEDAPGETPQITQVGRDIAKRFQVVKDGNRGYFEVVSFEPQDTKVHIRYNTIPTKKGRKELDAGQEMAYTDAWIDINEPNVVHIVGSVGTTKKVFPKRWRAEVTQRAREIRTGFDIREGQRMKGRVTAKVPFVGAPTLAMHTAQLEGQYLKDKKAEVQGRKLTKEEELKAREAARKDAKETQQKALDALNASQADVEGGLVNLPSLKSHELDRGINIETRISKGALARINNGTAQHERIFQVLPDGRMRTLEVVPQGKGKRYAVFALAEGGNKFVNPKTTSGRAIVSEGVKIGEVGPVVKDATLERIKQQGQKKTLSDGLRIIRQRKRTAGDAQVQDTPSVDEAAEGKAAAARIDYQAILKKEEAQRRQRREEAKREKAEDKSGESKIPYETSVAAKQLTKEEWEKIPAKVQRELEDLAVEDAELFDAAPGDILNRENMERIDLEELRSEEDSRITREERADEAVEEQYVPPREEAETASFVGPAAPKVRNLADALQRATTMFGNFPNIRQQVVDMYSINKAKVDKAIEQLQPYAETTYDEGATARQGGTKDGNMELRLFVESGGRPTLRGERQLSQVRAAMNAIMANSPSTANKGFKILIEEAKQYLATRPDLPLSKQENLDVEDLSELFLVAAASQTQKSPSSKKGWTETEVTDLYEVADLLVQEFGVSPIEAATRAQEILYGKNIGTDEFGNTKREGYPDLHNRTAQIVKAMTDRRAEAQTGGTLTEAEARAKEDLAVRDNLIRQVRDQLVVARARDDREAAFEAALDSALEKAGFGQQTQQVLEAVNRQKADTGVVLGSLQDKIARLEAALKEKDTLRTNYNAPVEEEVPEAPELSWVQSIAEEYNKQYKDGRDPTLYPDQLQLDISTLMEMKNPDTRPPKPKPTNEDVTLIEGNESVAERKLKEAEAAKKAQKKPASPSWTLPPSGRYFVQQFKKGRTEDEIGPMLKKRRDRRMAGPEMAPDAPIGPGYGVYLDVKGKADLLWKRSPVKMEDSTPPPTTPEQVEAAHRTVPLGPEAGRDHAAAFTSSMAVSYYASVAPIKNAKPGKAWWDLRRVWNRYTKKEGGSVKGTRSIAEEATGFIQYWQERAMDHWAQALSELTTTEKWGTAKDAAITHYLQGMSRDAVIRKTGFKIPAPAIKHLDRLRADIDQLSTMGVQSGAFTKTNVVAAILSGRAYLSAGLGVTELTSGQISKMMPELKELFEIAFPSLTEQQIASASLEMLYNTIENRMPNIQDNLSTAAVDGKVIGKDEGTKYNIRQLKVEGLDSPVPLAIVTDSGVLLEVLATDAQLQQIVMDNRDGEFTTEQEVQRLADSMTNASAGTGGTTLGRGADYGSQQARRLLRSEFERIGDAADRIINGKGTTPELRAWVGENLAEYKTGTMEEFLTAIEDQFPESAGVVAQARAENKLNAKLREALNEITDPTTRIAMTFENITETIAMARFSTDLYRLLKAQKLASIGDSPAGAQNWVRLMPKGTRLGDTNLVVTEQVGRAEGPGVRKVHEMYVPKEVADAVRDITGYGRELEGHGVKALRFASGVSKYGKVILNWSAHPRNLASTALIHASRGAFGHNSLYANKLMLGLARQQLKLGAGQMGRAWKERKMSAQGKRLEELMLLNNLFFDGGKSGAVYDLRREGFGVRTKLTGALHKTKRGGKAVLKPFEEAFRLEDEAVKAAALVTYASDYIQLTGGNVDIVEKYFETGNLTESEQKVFDKAIKVAAEQVKNTYPTFSRTPEFIKALSRNPFFGAFPSFSSEMVRTTGHAIYQNMSLMAGKLPDGTAIAEGQRARAFVLGATRMSGQVALFSGAAVIAQMLAEMVGDDDNENMEWYQYLTAYGTEAQRKARGLMPFWQRNQLAAVKDIDQEKGTFKTVAVSYLSPFGAFNDTINAMVNAYKDGLEAGVGSPEWEAAKALAEGMIGTFGNEEVFAGSIYKRFIRNVSKRESKNATKNWANDVDKAMGEWFAELGAPGAGNFWGAVVGGSIEAMTPEAIGQMYSTGIKLAGAIAASAPEDMYAENLATEHVYNITDFLWGIGETLGLKEREQNFEDDFIPGLAMDKLMFQKANTEFKTRLAKVGDDEDYYEVLKEAAAKRHGSYQMIRDRLKAAEDLLGKDAGDIIIETIKQGDRFRGTGDVSIGEFSLDVYTLPTPKEYLTALKRMDSLDLTDVEKYEAYSDYAVAYARWYEEEYDKYTKGR